MHNLFIFLLANVLLQRIDLFLPTRTIAFSERDPEGGVNEANYKKEVLKVE